MKTIQTLQFAALTMLALSAPSAIADDAHHPDQATSPTAATAPASADRAVQTMKENSRKMQAQLDKIAKTKDPKERQKLLHEHMQTMRANMMLGKGMMTGMMGCPMMEGDMGMMGGGMMGSGPGSDAMMQRMNQMEKRMDMMQMMMEQMSKPPMPGAPAK